MLAKSGPLGAVVLAVGSITASLVAYYHSLFVLAGPLRPSPACPVKSALERANARWPGLAVRVTSYNFQQRWYVRGEPLRNLSILTRLPP